MINHFHRVLDSLMKLCSSRKTHVNLLILHMKKTITANCYLAWSLLIWYGMTVTILINRFLVYKLEEIFHFLGQLTLFISGLWRNGNYDTFMDTLLYRTSDNGSMTKNWLLNSPYESRGIFDLGITHASSFLWQLYLTMRTACFRKCCIVWLVSNQKAAVTCNMGVFYSFHSFEQ